MRSVALKIAARAKPLLPLPPGQGWGEGKRQARPCSFRTRNGFTLVELLVTIAIIAILASMFLGALSKAHQAADIAATQALVVKLHGQMMLRYESYRTRRLPIPSTAGMRPFDVASLRLQVIRELMRMELPDRWTDVSTNPVIIVRPSISVTYQNRVLASATPEFEDAECLYLILTSGMADDAAGNQYTDTRVVGDADGDGMPEFHDSWGRPIRFIRWAPGFISDLQPTDSTLSSMNPLPLNSDPRFVGTHHDPFDPLKLQSNPLGYPTPTSPQPLPIMAEGFALYPLIYSHGLDHQDGIYHGPSPYNAAGQVAMILVPQPPAAPMWQPIPYNPYAHFTDPIAGIVQLGASIDTDGDGTPGEDADNITNHLIGQP